MRDSPERVKSVWQSPQHSPDKISGKMQKVFVQPASKIYNYQYISFFFLKIPLIHVIIEIMYNSFIKIRYSSTF